MAKTAKGHVKQYYMGSRFTKYRVVAYVLCSFIIFAFFFIYDYVFPSFGMEKLLAIFGLIEIVVMALIKQGGDWVIKNYYYEVNDNELAIVTGKHRMAFAWKDFSSVRLNGFDVVNLCPFEYTIAGKKLQINQYLDNPWDLNVYIMDHIRDHVEVPEEIYHQADVMRK